MRKKYSQIIRHEGNEALFKLIDIAIAGAINDIPIHLHVEGLRGTGKTTIIRATKDILPKIKRIKGCVYNCNPLKPHCPEHRNLTEKQISSVETEMISMPFLEISPTAKRGTVAGSIDLKKLTSKGNIESSMLLGTIPRAHRGIIFIDEINRLTDVSPEIADILLDVMGTKPGRIQIEETGFETVELPVQVTVWAASNPDEDPGPLEEIRRQLSDRFDFSINVERPKEIEVVRQILLAATKNENKHFEQSKTYLLEQSKYFYNFKQTPNNIIDLLSALYIKHGIESLRSIESVLYGLKIKTAVVKKEPGIKDVLFFLRHSLRHRIDSKSLNEIMMAIDTKDSESKYKSKTINCPGDNRISKMRPSFLEKVFGAGRMRAEKEKTKPSIVAPPNKATSIKDLHLKDYIKTEEELN